MGRLVLTRLHIQNFIILENIELEFFSGLIVITGETGAGKSVIIDALSLLMGGKAENKVIGPAGDKCHLTACFDIKDIPNAQTWLLDNEFADSLIEECIVKRVFHKDGKSRQMINGFQCTLHQARDFLTLLINIHGQHQQQQLIKQNYQRELLDNFMDEEELGDKVQHCFNLWLKNEKKLADLKSIQKNSEIQQELLEYQIQEFDKIGFAAEEYIQLQNEYKQLANASQLMSNCQEALANLSEREKTSAENLMYQAQNRLAAICHFDQKITTANEMLQNALIHLKEAVAEIQDFYHHFEANPERLEFLENRLSKIHQLARKYQVTPNQLNEIHQELRVQLIRIKEAKNQEQLLLESQKVLLGDYLLAAKKLSEHRKKAAEVLSHKITEKMNQLGMAGGFFKIDIQMTSAPNPHGSDNIQFFVSTNPGFPPQPLAKIASGGEISRIALGIYACTAQKKTTPMLVFDEVDVGIGGATAAIVGSLLKTLSNSAQIFCITHLPQVAAFGDKHFKVKKKISTHQTYTSIVELKEEERIQEVARMLGGIQITEKTLAHAKELIGEVAVLADPINC